MHSTATRSSCRTSANNAATQNIVINASPGQALLDGLGSTISITANGGGYRLTFLVASGGWAVESMSTSGAIPLASAWGQGTSTTFDEAGEIGASATGTPQSTGLIRAWLDLSCIANAEVVFVYSITEGTGSLSPPLLELLTEIGASTEAYPAFSVDLDRLGTPFIAPLGEPLTLNLVGKAAGGTVTEILGTIAWQERAQ
jgi:hypothetical protein